MSDQSVSRIVFVTAADLSGTTGDSVATREIVAALAAHQSVELLLLSPTPTGDLPEDIDRNVGKLVSLPKKPTSDSTWRTLLWHGQLQASIASHLSCMLVQDDIDLVLTRVNPSMFVPPLITVLAQTQYSILVRGMVSRNISFGPVARLVVCLNSRMAGEAYVAYQAVKDAIDHCRPSASPSTIFPNAVDPDKFKPVKKSTVRNELNISSEEFVVGFVGTLRKRHKTALLLRGAAETDVSVSLLIVGDGPEREELERLAEELDIKGLVRFTGAVPHSEVNRYISACDVCYGVVDPERPSNPIKIYEYLACERPVITSQNEELSFIEDNNFGEVVQKLTPTTIGNSIESLSQLPSDDLDNKGARGREYIKQNHTWSKFGRKIIDDMEL